MCHLVKKFYFHCLHSSCWFCSLTSYCTIAYAVYIYDSNSPYKYQWMLPMIRQGEIWASFLTKCSMLNYIYYTVLPFLPMQPPSAVVVTPPIRQQPPPLQKLLCEKVHPLCQHSYHHNNHYYHCYHTGIRFGYMYLSCSLWWLDASGDHT